MIVFLDSITQLTKIVFLQAYSRLCYHSSSLLVNVSFHTTESQNVRSGQTDKATFGTPSKSNADEHRVQSTIEEAVKRSSAFEAVNFNAAKIGMTMIP